MLKAFAPPIDWIARRWTAIEPLLQRATSRGFGYEPIDLLIAVTRGQFHMWIILDEDADKILAAAVTEIKQLPRLRFIEMLFLSGTEMNRWHDVLWQRLDAYALEAGCTKILGFGRKGWNKFFRPTCTLYERIPQRDADA